MASASPITAVSGFDLNKESLPSGASSVVDGVTIGGKEARTRVDEFDRALALQGVSQADYSIGLTKLDGKFAILIKSDKWTAEGLGIETFQGLKIVVEPLGDAHALKA